MLAITFKNVGHGDTIILEWKNDKGENEVGIIDCHLINGQSNLVIEHIRTYRYKKIKFLILTHPHTNHFSGFPSLLEFCKKRKINIEMFLHTVVYHREFLIELHNERVNLNEFFDSFVNRIRDRKILKRLFREIHLLSGTSILRKVGAINDSFFLRLKKKLWLECLSPSYDELAQYYQIVFSLNSKRELEIRKKENSPDANLLSAIIKISTDDWDVLLFSDAKKSSVKRIMNDYQKNNKRLIAMQIPGHGSIHSHFEPSWRNIPGKENIPVFVSVGPKYGDPSKKVIQFYAENFREVHSTNCVGGFREYFEEMQNLKGNPEKKIEAIKSLYYKFQRGHIEQDLSSLNCGEKRIELDKNGIHTISTFPKFTN